MAQSRKDIVAWVGSHILPHEGAVRAWLRHWGGRWLDLDDVVQEVYCRLATLEDVTHISNGRAYFFQAARNIVLEQARRAKIVRIDNVTDIGALSILDESPSIERIVGGARELQRVQELIGKLPSKCQRVFILRRIHGVPQREIAETLGMSEAAVEKQATRGLKLILKAIESDEASDANTGERRERERERHRNR